ncbi:MAG TPA: PAS domain-containing protein [Acidimicrobiia bacterium]|nr:PAS domain-containing protein [Acidimicrobiia bacterium]HZQ76704.1 PAS domain-containing protein [Acidimicrobiia bacterium]
MDHKPIELILLRQLASRLPLPVALADAEGNLVYFNPATERLLGFEQATLGEYPIGRFDELLDPRHPDGTPMKAQDMTIAVALHGRRPQQGRMILHGADGRPHEVVSTAVPLDGQGGTLLGSMSIFWEPRAGA